MKFILSTQNLLDLKAIGELNPKDSREAAKIIVIDDKDVPQIEILKDRGYSIKHISDIEDIGMLESYDIILVDIKNIGKRFKSPLEGAYVAKKAKETFPYKKVLLFTGNTYEDKYNEALRKCDGYLTKDSGADDWEDELERHLKSIVDPISQWKILRSRLLDSDVPILIVYDLEQQYIKAFKMKNSEIFPNSNTISKLEPIAKSMVIGLAKSALFRSLGLIGK